jgi:murein DD-endopeptidase MepM/ murein hydrolase activator NlpD
MVTEKESKWKRFKRKLHNKYRFVVMNDSTFEKKFSFRLTPYNLFVAVGTIAIILIISTTFIIAYTPLREYIPGYGDVNLQKDVFKIVSKADSLEKEIAKRDLYLMNISYIIQGKDFPLDTKKPADTTLSDFNDMNADISKEDSLFREEIESVDKYNLIGNKESSGVGSLTSFFFFAPIKGIITNNFNVYGRHYGIDIVAGKNEAVKAALEGTVIFSDWTVKTGYVIGIQHQSNILTVYKHNSVLLKKEGDYVRAGEPIAIVGESGELTTGPHLHFELWYNGKPVNPKEYISF